MNKCGRIPKRWKTNGIRLLEKQENVCARSGQEETTRDVRAIPETF